MKLGVIGTAGRNGQHKQIGLKGFQGMVDHVLGINPDEIISGGAAWADHAGLVAALQLHIPLTLHLPCNWDYKAKEFEDNGIIADANRNPGGIANYYHRLMMQETARYSLLDLHQAIIKSENTILVSHGFKARNTKIAQEADLILAFTMAEGDQPEDGGTKNTWDKAKNLGKECIHIPIRELL